LAGAVRAAFLIEPPEIILKTAMNETMAWVDVVNSGTGPIAVELTMYERVLDIDGEARAGSLPKSGDFTVYPSQIVLQPRERARVQVSYKSKRKVTADRAYLLFSREVLLPVGEDAEDQVRTGVNTLINYYSVVAFETGKAGKLTFVSSKALGGGKVEVVVENKSQGRVSGDGLVITVGGKEKIRDFTGKKNSIMPGQKRRFTFDYARPLTAREVTFGHK
jgi:P pilus assembly chaperone PapD